MWKWIIRHFYAGFTLQRTANRCGMLSTVISLYLGKPCQTLCRTVYLLLKDLPCFPLKLHAGGIRPQTIWRFWIKDVSVDERVGACSCVFGQAHQGLTVEFPLLEYSVVCTFESLSLFYLLFISWFVCPGRWCIDKVGICHANQTSMCLDPHQN